MDWYKKKSFALSRLKTSIKYKSVTQIFAHLMRKFSTADNRYLGEIFNFCLVYVGIRKCILLEPINYIYHTGDDTFINFIHTIGKINTELIGLLSDKNKIPRIFVYNKKLINNLTEDDVDNDIKIGNILGFECPGQMSGSRTINFMINNISFYTEICFNPLSKTTLENIEKKYKRFNNLAGLLNLNLSKNISFRLTIKQAKHHIINKEYNTIFSLKNEYENIFVNFYYNTTGYKFSIITTQEEMKQFIDTYDKLLLIMLEYILNDPVRILSTTVEENTKIKKLIDNLETNLYSIF